MAEINIKNIQISSTNEFSKYPILRSWVEKPPIAIVEKLCAIASKADMPAI
tara:strand:+ start:282 stop:434 length:153 start_codon:yes stop_codon:yes gene_type:complete